MLAERYGLTVRLQRANSQLAEGNIHGQRVVLAKPQTYMNLSGQAVVALCNWYKIDPARELLVIYDDLDLPFAKLRIRERGSAGTHNGMRSIVAQLGTTEFPRLRVGIGQPPGKMAAADYVLGRFTPDEEAALPDLLGRIADAVEVILREGLTTAMNRYNPL